MKGILIGVIASLTLIVPQRLAAQDFVGPGIIQKQRRQQGQEERLVRFAVPSDVLTITHVGIIREIAPTFHRIRITRADGQIFWLDLKSGWNGTTSPPLTTGQHRMILGQLRAFKADREDPRPDIYAPLMIRNLIHTERPFYVLHRNSEVQLNPQVSVQGFGADQAQNGVILLRDILVSTYSPASGTARFDWRSSIPRVGPFVSVTLTLSPPLFANPVQPGFIQDIQRQHPEFVFAGYWELRYVIPRENYTDYVWVNGYLFDDMSRRLGPTVATAEQRTLVLVVDRAWDDWNGNPMGVRTGDYIEATMVFPPDGAYSVFARIWHPDTRQWNHLVDFIHP